MLFAVERLSERSEDWPTNGIELDTELNIRAAGLARRKVTKKLIHLLVGHLVQQRKVLPPPPKLSCNKKIQHVLANCKLHKS